MVRPALELEAVLRARELVHAIERTELEHEIMAELEHREAAHLRRNPPRRAGSPTPRCATCRRFRRRSPGPCGSCGFDTSTGRYPGAA